MVINRGGSRHHVHAAVTIVAAWINALTGVGPSIASGSQTYRIARTCPPRRQINNGCEDTDAAERLTLNDAHPEPANHPRSRCAERPKDEHDREQKPKSPTGSQEPSARVAADL
jgi:hypothetical protein